MRPIFGPTGHARLTVATRCAFTVGEERFKRPSLWLPLSMSGSDLFIIQLKEMLLNMMEGFPLVTKQMIAANLGTVRPD
jgi:hypothetical protein